MKVSEAIAQLIEFEETFGDVEVVFDSNSEPSPVAPPHEHPADKISDETRDWINSLHSRN